MQAYLVKSFWKPQQNGSFTKFPARKLKGVTGGKASAAYGYVNAFRPWLGPKDVDLVLANTERRAA